MDGQDRYGTDVLADFAATRRVREPDPVEAADGLVVEEAGGGFCGAVVGADAQGVRLEDRLGLVRMFPWTSGFLIDGVPVRLVRPAAQAQRARTRTASGSFGVSLERARTARGGRLFVEGGHDAELVERVWGDDLRVEGVVVEILDGVDRLEAALDAHRPQPSRRAGVLVDHLVPGSKEHRIAEAVARRPDSLHVLVVGHPFVDVWQAVKPERLGLPRWPDIPREIEWKAGACAALGLPHATRADIAAAWKQILGRVRGFGDLEAAFLGRVEELIDFVTVDEPSAEGPVRRTACREGRSVGGA